MLRMKRGTRHVNSLKKEIKRGKTETEKKMEKIERSRAGQMKLKRFRNKSNHICEEELS